MAWSRGGTNGLVEVQTEIRRICNTLENLAEWLGRGARLHRTFPTRQAAEDWLRAPAPAPCPTPPWCGLEDGQGTRQVTNHANELARWLGQGYHHARTFSSMREAWDWQMVARFAPARAPPVQEASTVPQGKRSSGGVPARTAPDRVPPACVAPPVTQGRRSSGGATDGARQTSMQRAPEPAVDPTNEGEPATWHGLTEGPRKTKVICRLLAECLDLIRKGATLRRTFWSEEEAIAWLRVPSDGPGGGPTTRRAEEPGQGPRIPAREGHWLEEIHDVYQRFSGEDPSVGDEKRIYGIECADVEPMEKALCPPGLDAQECSQFVKRSTDTTSLPGMCSAENCGEITIGEGGE